MAIVAALTQFGGPVIADMLTDRYYALISCIPNHAWRYDEAALLASGSYLGVPRADIVRPPGVYWAVPPRAPGDLCALPAVTTTIDLGRRRLREASG